MRAHDFTKEQPNGSRVPFGVDRTAVVKQLRAIAQRIEDREIQVESVRVQSLASVSGFTASLLRLKLYEPRAFRASTPEEVAEFAAAGGFPLKKGSDS